MRKREILSFISNFDGAQDTFLHGCCYWFTHILSARFGGETFYEPVEGHFIQRINGEFYDVRGDVSGLYKGKDLVMWRIYSKIDPLHYKVIVRDCVLKKDYHEQAAV